MTPKGNSKFEILLVKILSLKQKLNQILPVTTEKIKFCLVNKQPRLQVYKGLQRKKKKKSHQIGIFIILQHVQAHSDICKCKQAYPKIIQAYLGISRTLCDPSIFRTPIYSEGFHIENQRHIQTLVYSKPEACSEP